MTGGLESTYVIASVLAEFPSLGGAYVVALIVGGGLVLVSVLFGGDADHGAAIDGGADFNGEIGAAELHGDVDAAGADLHTDGALHDGMHVADWFSVRFVIYFAAMFGLTGTILTYTSDMGRGGVLAVALLAGVVIGQIVHQTMRWLKRSSVEGATNSADYLDRPGRVTVSIPAKGRGEVAIQVRDGERCLPAMARRENDAFATGSQVSVVEIRGGTAVVVSRQEHEFLKQ